METPNLKPYTLSQSEIKIVLAALKCQIKHNQDLIAKHNNDFFEEQIDRAARVIDDITDAVNNGISTFTLSSSQIGIALTSLFCLTNHCMFEMAKNKNEYNRLRYLESRSLSDKIQAYEGL